MFNFVSKMEGAKQLMSMGMGCLSLGAHMWHMQSQFIVK